jgi:hypothetical protein
METLLLFWGWGHVGLVGFAIITGTMYHIKKPLAGDHILTKLVTIDRRENPGFFWIVVLGNLGWGSFLIYYTKMNF